MKFFLELGNKPLITCVFVMIEERSIHIYQILMEDCAENGKCHFKTKDKTYLISERISLGISPTIKEQKLGYTFSDFF